MRKHILLFFIFLFFIPSMAAQDAFNLSSELFVLYNQGTVERFGLGTSGVTQVTPDNVFVLDFAVAPDGNWLVYRTQQGLVLNNIFRPDEIFTLEGESAGIPISRGRGDTLVWSPDSQAIAYTTLEGIRVNFRGSGVFFEVAVPSVQHLTWSLDGEYLAAKTEENVWWIYRNDGTQLTLASAVPSARNATWLSATQFIFVSPEGGFIVMDLANANTQVPVLDSSWDVFLPYYEGNFQMLFFARRTNDDTPDGFGQLFRLTFGQEVEIEPVGDAIVQLANLRWANGGRFLLSFQGGVLVLINPQDGQGFTLPISGVVAYGWGPIQPARVDGFALPSDAYFLAEDLNNITQVWRFPQNGDTPQTITPATNNISDFAISPDKSQIAYISDNTLYLFQQGEESENILLHENIESIQGSLLFHANGESLFYLTKTEGIHQIVFEDGSTEIILPHQPDASIYTRMQFAPNINALLLFYTDGNQEHLAVLDLNTRELIEVGAYAKGFWLRDGRILVYNTQANSEIVIFDTNTQSEAVGLFTLPENITVHALMETRPGLVQLISTPNLAGPVTMTIINIPIGGRASRIGEIPLLLNPQFSPDGSLVIGYHPEGALLIHTLETNKRVQLRDPLAIQQFTWR